MADYFVDPTNGDNSNDGLTPATAFADIFTGVGGFIDIPTFWVRRGETISISATKTINYGDIKTWPHSTDSNYADRPQSGIDAGWDADLSDPALISIDAVITPAINISELHLARLSFKGVHFSINVLTGTLFALRSARLIFDDCQFMADDIDAYYFFSYSSGSTGVVGDNGRLELNRCHIENKNWSQDSSLLCYYKNEDLNYEKQLYITDTTILGLATVLYSIASANARKIDCTVSNSVLKLSHYFSRVSNNSGNYQQLLTVTIDDSEVAAGVDVFETAQSSSHVQKNSQYYLTNSSFDAGEYIVDDYRNTSSVSTFSLLQFDIDNCQFKAKRFYSNHHANRVQIPSCVIRNSTFKDMSLVFFFYGIGQIDEFIFANNTLIEVERLIEVTGYGEPQKFNISLKGQNLTGALVNRSSGGSVYLEDCNVGKELAGADTKDMHIVAVNSNFDAIQGEGHTVSLTSCRLESSNGTALAGVNGQVSDTQIISPYAKILDESSMVAFDGCNLSVKGINTPAGAREYKLVKTVLNGLPIPLRVESDRMMREISPINRATGAPYSLFLQSVPLGLDSRVVNGDVYIKHLISKPNLTVFMTSVDDITDVDKVSIKASFVSEGILTVVNMTITDDPSSQWDGIQSSHNKYKSTVDLSGHTIAEGSKIKIVLSLSNTSEHASSLNVDTQLGQE